MDKKRVLVWYWGRKGGAARQTYEIVKAFSARDDVEVYVSLCMENELYEETVALSKDSYNVSIYPNLVRLVFNTMRMPLYRQRFKEFITQRKIDIVYSIMGHAVTGFISRCIKYTDAIYINTIHDAAKHPGEKYNYTDKVINRSIKNADYIITHSKYVHDFLIENGYVDENKCLTIPLGAYAYNDNYTARDIAGKDIIRLLFFGRIVQYKGLNLAIGAYKILLDKGYSVELEISGDGDFSEYYGLIDGTPGIILNNRWIEDSEISTIFNRADIVLIPYVEASQSGVVALAMDMGVPVVVTPVGGLVEQVSETGVIASEVSAEAIAEKVIWLLTDLVSYRQVSSKELIYAQTKLSWNVVLDGIVNCCGKKNENRN